MKRIINSILIIAVVVLASGCNTTGLSVRESQGFNYSSFIYGLYDKDEQEIAEPKPMNSPIQLAVAQIGENTPPDSLLEKFEENRHLIARLNVIPAGRNRSRYYYNNDNVDSDEFVTRMKKMRKFAQDLNSDYLFIFGGSADYGTNPNPLMFFDLTILGGFLLPSQEMDAEGRVAGALVDVKTGRVLFTVNSEARINGHTPTFLMDGNQNKMLVELRNELVDQLGDAFLIKLKNHQINS